MKSEKDYVQRDILKSIVNEFYNYIHWKKLKEEVKQEVELINRQMYELSGITYDKIPQKNRIGDYESKLVQLITKKDILMQFINFIDIKVNFVDMMLLLMNEKDRTFIRKALIYRSVYDTNDTIAVRNDITESGVRYKINTIIKNTFDIYLNKKDERGGIVESITK